MSTKIYIDILEEADLLGVKPAKVPIGRDLVLTTTGNIAL